MNGLFVLLLMMFCHIVDDYYLQGKLALFKQKSWWEEKAPDQLYKYDYIVALIMHSFSWAFMIMLPVLIAFSLNPPLWFWFNLLFNVCLHAMIDNLKCNELKINLIQDQLIHLAQILTTWIMYVLEFYLG